MRIVDFLEENRIALDLKAGDKNGAIDELADMLGKTGEVTDPGMFVNDILERERLGTTGIGNDIAIPHARTDAVQKFVIAFGRSQKGINFDSLDGKPARLIFLMGTPKEKNLNNYLKILAHLTRLLQRKPFREALLRAESVEAVLEEFRRAEQ